MSGGMTAACWKTPYRKSKLAEKRLRAAFCPEPWLICLQIRFVFSILYAAWCYAFHRKWKKSAAERDGDIIDIRTGRAGHNQSAD